MHDRVQLIHSTALESQFGQAGPLQTAVGGEDGRAENAHNFIKNRLARLHHGATQRIGLDDLGAQLPQIARDSALAAAQAAGKADPEHDLKPPPQFGGAHCVSHQHGNGQRTHTAGHGPGDLWRLGDRDLTFTLNNLLLTSSFYAYLRDLRTFSKTLLMGYSINW